LLLLLFEILPDWYKKRQINKLIELGITGTVSQADYFRLQPYEESDYGRFQRADKRRMKRYYNGYYQHKYHGYI